MARRAAERKTAGRARQVVEGSTSDFSRYRQPGDPDEILPEILAARCLGITYGDPGPKLPPETCRPCWGDRYVWLGNTWGLQHAGGPLSGCQHDCHDGEVWLA